MNTLHSASSQGLESFAECTRSAASYVSRVNALMPSGIAPTILFPAKESTLPHHDTVTTQSRLSAVLLQKGRGHFSSCDRFYHTASLRSFAMLTYDSWVSTLMLSGMVLLS